MSSFKTPSLYISLAIALVITVLLFPQQGKFKYSYHRGRPWMYETLISTIDFPVLKTQQELLAEREEKASKVIPYYNFDRTVALSNINALKENHQNDGIDKQLLYFIVEQLQNIYATGIVPGSVEASQEGIIVVQRDKRAQELPYSEVYTTKRALRELKSNIAVSFPACNVDSLFGKLGLAEYVKPNLIYDQNKTELFHKDAVEYISPTKGMFYTGQMIVAEGEIITAEIEQLLDSYKKEYEQTYGYAENQAGLVFGHFILCLLILASLLAVLYFTKHDLVFESRIFTFVLTLYVLLFAITVLIRNLDTSILVMVPYSVFALYMLMFMKPKHVFPIYTIMLLPLLCLTEDGVDTYLLNLTGGIVTIICFKYFNKGWAQFLISVFAFIGMMLVYVGILFSQDGTGSMFSYGHIIFIALNAILIVAAFPFVYLFERIFSLVSHSRLTDLSDTNNRLLRELAVKAPGTFQHSLQVSNLAADAAREIGADDILVRVGALYHDIGKMKNPQCFVENAPVGFNYHKELSPIESAQQIIRHVDDGVEIARKHKLPEKVIDFIRTHHARTLTAYFYTQYCNDGGDSSNVEPFMYHGELPTSREQVIVLMADAIEAASRSLKDYSEESISNLVEKIVGQRLSDSQLVQADISIKDITLLKAMFKARLEQMYHERIAYPKMKGEK